VFKEVPIKIVVPIIVITWILSLISALAIVSTGMMGQGPAGPQGPQGEAGPAGATGPQGPPGISTFNYSLGSGSITTSYTSLGNVAITAPTNGVVHILLTGDVYTDGNEAVIIGIANTTNSVNLGSTYVGHPFGSTSESLRLSFTTQAIVNVVAGNTYTFYINARMNIGTGPVGTGSIKISAVLYPV